MSLIKCIGCYELLREELVLGGKELVVYNCPRFFPYSCHLSGLLKPAKGILRAAEECPEQPLGHCILCPSTELLHYGEDIVSICKYHDRRWGDWLNNHPWKREYMAPRHRAIKARWIEVFREFIEDIRAAEVK